MVVDQCLALHSAKQRQDAPEAWPSPPSTATVWSTRARSTSRLTTPGTCVCCWRRTANDRTGLLIVSRFDAGVTIPAGLVVVSGLGPNWHRRYLGRRSGIFCGHVWIRGDARRVRSSALGRIPRFWGHLLLARPDDGLIHYRGAGRLLWPRTLCGKPGRRRWRGSGRLCLECDALAGGPERRRSREREHAQSGLPDAWQRFAGAPA